MRAEGPADRPAKGNALVIGALHHRSGQRATPSTNGVVEPNNLPEPTWHFSPVDAKRPPCKNTQDKTGCSQYLNRSIAVESLILNGHWVMYAVPIFPRSRFIYVHVLE